MAVPRLVLDRPFTYRLDGEAGAGTGSLVSVPFHGRTVKGWVLGPAREVPEGRLLPVRRVRSPVRFFDLPLLALLRWVGERYLAPLCTVIERSHPPRVAAVEAEVLGGVEGAERPVRSGRGPGRAGDPPGSAGPAAGAASPVPGLDLVPGTLTWLRPLPGEEAEACVAAVRACLEAGRRAIVVVPEADPVPFTARAVLRAFPGRGVALLGGDARARYRTWLEVLAGRHRVVVGTRGAVFAPLPDLGLIWVAREVHPAHREDRSPYYRVREVAEARARIEGAACVLASLCPSVETAADVRAGRARVARPPRSVERAAAPLVETAAPEGEDRSVRLGSLLRAARSAALIVSRRGYGVARVCRSCGQPAACAACGGPVVREGGRTACRACGAEGVCAACGGRSFGLERGGTERVAEWAGRVAGIPVLAEEAGGPPPPPGPGRVVVGTAAAVKDVGPARVDLVAVLDPDRALARPGLRAPEQALATWMEAAAWAGPRAGGGRVLVQTRRPGHPAIQALVRWEPLPFLLAEAARRSRAGFPPGHPVFRVEGQPGVEEALRAAGAGHLLAAPRGDRTLCLLAVAPEGLPPFRREVLRLAVEGAVTRVEAEPEL